jgi:hypothetical protein
MTKEMTKEQAKRISPRLENDTKWHEYVDWFWTKPGFKEQASFLALGFEAGSRA